MYDLVKEIVRWGVVMAIVAMLASCQMVGGMGRDITWTAETLEATR